ncbi:ubiquitin-conjugating enzyme E2 L3 [Schistosoma bovis]|uniref:Ubiquitin-conjugating enzyme E2 L3 n=1 Tax=Schistosoma bovis TaxID=6184 RepID=A0A430Q3C0_SCHBO|nr:ubiquitin-conjugating enzyme E2 L3 [Schistosoma bovis]
MSQIYVMFWLELEKHLLGVHFIYSYSTLVAMLHAPEVEHALRSDLAEEYAKDQKKFFKNAEEFTRKYAEKIPNL